MSAMATTEHRRYAWQDAPSADEYTLIKEDIQNNIEEQYRDECYFLFVIMGELGLRGGEVSHMSRSWIDFDNKTIKIPTYDECTDGRDGGICGYCKSQAKQAYNRHGRPLEEALDERWRPKNDAASRVVPFAWSEEVNNVLLRFFRNNPDGYDKCRSSINKRFNRIARATDMVANEEDLYPHAMRARAGIKHARNGIGAYQLTQFMGWESVEGAIPYIEMAASDVTASFQRVYQNSGFY